MTAALLLSLLKCPGAVICRLPGGRKNKLSWGLYANPHEILIAWKHHEVEPLFQHLEAAVQAGAFAAGFLSYEAGKAFDVNLASFADDSLPLAVFALYAEAPLPLRLPDESNASSSRMEFQPELSYEEYAARIEIIRNHIREGDVYQANFTCRCIGKRVDEPEKLFLHLNAVHPVPYAAYLHLAGQKILSLSPELFLECDGRRLRSRPMKGTARRSPLAAEDSEIIKWLRHDPKNLAENVMIVDMVRNDLSRLCIPGSISVKNLFHIDTYRTVHQMVSTVEGRLHSGQRLYDILQATFPPASVTGAPKISAVDLICRHENSARGIYTGIIGAVHPGNKFCFNVAIRTLTCSEKETRLGVGGGITYDSNALDEWQEMLLKSRFAGSGFWPDFAVFETILWQGKNSWLYLEEHLQRAAMSQGYFGRSFNESEVRRKLSESVNPFPDESRIVRFVLKKNGEIEISNEAVRQPDWQTAPLRVLVSNRKTESNNIFLYHKTSYRPQYQAAYAAARQDGFHEVLFTNQHGDLTEGSISNLFLKIKGEWLTPGLQSGLLPGIWRAKMRQKLEARETRLPLVALSEAEEILLGNSVRGTGRISEIVYQ